MKKHILVISQYFYPEQFRINDICLEWIKRGYKITVVTGIPNYPQGKYYNNYGLFKKRKENYNGIEVIRIPLIPRGRTAVMLVLNYVSFVVTGMIWEFITKIKADYVFIFEVSPMTQALPGIWYAKKRKIPCYLYVQDLWPENVEIITGIKNKCIIGTIAKMVDYIYKNCTKIFTTSESFVRSINNRGVAIEKIKYWPQYAEDFYIPLEKKSIQEIPNDGYFNIIYTGNIGMAQGLEILPKVAELIQGLDQQIRFNIVGDGRYKNELMKIVETKGLNNMFNFIDSQPASKIPLFIAASNAAFLCLTDSPLFAMTIPAKLQSYMACGIPIIASADGETYKIINESKSGVCIKPGMVKELIDAILQFSNMTEEKLKVHGNNARRYYENNFNKKLLLDSIDNYFI